MNPTRDVAGTVHAAVIVPDPPGTLPFVPLREQPLHAGRADRPHRRPRGRRGGDGAGRTVDEVIGDWFHGPGHGVDFAIARALHDATIDVALAAPPAGPVGGRRDGRARRRPRRRPVRRGGASWDARSAGPATTWRPVAGPALMEAANLGAWFAPAADRDLDDRARRSSPAAPSYDTDAGRLRRRRARDVRDRWPVGGESLGVPTWVYLDEPTSAFATHIAKYFTNSIREDGLLAIARSGVVYTPGGAGTAQEIFTDTAQNSLTRSTRSAARWCSSVADFFERDDARARRRGPAPGRRVRLVRAGDGGRRHRRRGGVRPRARSRRATARELDDVAATPPPTP